MADASTNKKTLKTGFTGFVKSINFLIDNQPHYNYVIIKRLVFYLL